MTEQNNEFNIVSEEGIAFAPPLVRFSEYTPGESFRALAKIVATKAAEICKVDVELLSQKTRKSDVIMARYLSWKIIYDHTATAITDRGQRLLSLDSIGKMFGNYDHATVLWGRNKANTFVHGDGNRVPPDPIWLMTYEKIMNELSLMIGYTYNMDEENLFFPFSKRGYQNAMQFLWDIGAFEERKKRKEDVIIFANKQINKYR